MPTHTIPTNHKKRYKAKKRAFEEIDGEVVQSVAFVLEKAE